MYKYEAVKSKIVEKITPIVGVGNRFLLGKPKDYLRENKICTFAGYLPIKWNDRKSFAHQQNTLIWEITQTLSIDDKYYGYVPNKEVWGGALDTGMENYIEMARRTKRNPSINELMQTVKRHSSELCLPQQTNIDATDVLRVRINPEGNAGIITSRVIAKSKYGSRIFSQIISMGILLDMLKRIVPNVDLWEIAGRGKAIKLNKNGVVKTRPVLMAESWLVIIGGILSQYWSKWLKHGNIQSIILSRTHNYKNVQQMCKHMNSDCNKQNSVWLSPDWKNYDQTLYEELIVVANAIICNVLPDDEYNKRYIGYMNSSIVIKNIVIENGVVYRIDKGMPSGHPWTSLTNTICNWIIWQWILDKAVLNDLDRKECKIIVYGDDTQVYLSDKKYLNEVIKWSNNCGLQSKEDLNVSDTYIKSDTEKGAMLLKKVIDKSGYHCWDDDEAVDSMMYPKDDIRKRIEIEKIISILHDSPIIIGGGEIIRKYIKWLMKYKDESNLQDIIDVIIYKSAVVNIYSNYSQWDLLTYSKRESEQNTQLYEFDINEINVPSMMIMGEYIQGVMEMNKWTNYDNVEIDYNGVDIMNYIIKTGRIPIRNIYKDWTITQILNDISLAINTLKNEQIMVSWLIHRTKYSYEEWVMNYKDVYTWSILEYIQISELGQIYADKKNTKIVQIVKQWKSRWIIFI